MFAVLNDHLEIVQFLVGCGADIYAVNNVSFLRVLVMEVGANEFNDIERSS
jgi:hypothetical protein